VEGDRSCRSCQKSQLWTRGGARFFWRRAWRKLRISAPRAGGEEVVDSAEGEKVAVGLSWEDILCCCNVVFGRALVVCSKRTLVRCCTPVGLRRCGKEIGRLVLVFVCRCVAGLSLFGV
jgi:hypothetical protein